VAYFLGHFLYSGLYYPCFAIALRLIQSKTDVTIYTVFLLSMLTLRDMVQLARATWNVFLC